MFETNDFINVAETPTEVAETPTEVAETPTEVAETPTEVAETPTEVAETPTELVDTTNNFKLIAHSITDTSTIFNIITTKIKPVRDIVGKDIIITGMMIHEKLVHGDINDSNSPLVMKKISSIVLNDGNIYKTYSKGFTSQIEFLFMLGYMPTEDNPIHCVVEKVSTTNGDTFRLKLK